MNVVAFTMLLLATTCFAYLRGGAPERITALVFVIAFIATVASYRSFPQRFMTIEPFVAAIDLVVLAGLIIILAKADRFWPIAVCATQGLAVLTHVIKLIDPLIVRRAYAIAMALPGWLAVVVLFVGVYRHVLRVRCGGPERDWSW